MQVILLERIRNLGFMGEVVDVAGGYARHYLLPRKKALRCSEENMKYFESRKKELETHNLEKKVEAEKVAAKMQNFSVIIIRQAGDNGQLYGSVSSRDIAQSICNEGIQITYYQVLLNKPIKNVGIYGAKIHLHPEVDVAVKVNVALSKDAAQAQVKALEEDAKKARKKENPVKTTDKNVEESDESKKPEEVTKGKKKEG